MSTLNLRTLSKDFLGSVLSALCLVLAFPRTDWGPLAWVGLVPLMLVLDGKKFPAAFGWSYFCGILFFAGTLYWFIHVTVLGAVLLVLYFALYFGLFGLGYSLFPPDKTFQKFYFLPSWWVVLEFIRAHFLSGFGWASLGHSQYKNLSLIQIADVTGVFGVSFLVVMVNVFGKEILPLLFRNGDAYRKGRFYAALMTCVLLSVLGYGMLRLKAEEKTSAALSGAREEVSIAVVQANIAQDMKWYEPAWPGIMAEYMALTKEAAQKGPDLIVWPESSYPGILWEDKELFEKLKDLVRQIHVPLLVGAVTREGKDYYNSAILLSERGEIAGQYRKVHLVPFGEYIPFRYFFPFLSRIVPIADFTAAQEYTVFPLPVKRRERGSRHSFSVLICFEDTVPSLSRKFSKNGAGILINITNDAWFGDTKAPFLHLQSSVFRTIENRRGLVRSANTGVSCFIDAAGRIYKTFEDDGGKKTYTAGYTMASILPRSARTFYMRFGDVFALGCLGCVLWRIFQGIFLRKLN